MRYQKDSNYRRWIRSKEWTALRARYAQEHPYCEECQKAHKLTVMQHVHHKQPVESFASVATQRAAMFNYNNLESVCIACHNKLHDRSKQKAVTEERRQNHKRAFIEKFGKD